VVSAGFEGDIERRASRPLAGLAKCRNLGVLLTVSRVKAFANNLTVANDDGADHGVRRRLSPPASGEVQRPTHVRVIVLAFLRRAFVRHRSSESDAHAHGSVEA
jgi:hypothetical protein